jgi:hypothetical protein
MRWRMGCGARGGRQAVFADVPHIRAKGSGAEMRMDAAGGGGKGQLKGTIQDCSIEVGRCLRLSPLLCPTPPPWPLQQDGSYLRYTGRDANGIAMPARNPYRKSGASTTQLPRL